MNRIVICFSETFFLMGTFIVKRLLRGGQFVLFLNMPPKRGRPPQPVPFPGVGRGERPLRHRGRGPP